MYARHIDHRYGTAGAEAWERSAAAPWNQPANPGFVATCPHGVPLDAVGDGSDCGGCQAEAEMQVEAQAWKQDAIATARGAMAAGMPLRVTFLGTANSTLWRQWRVDTHTVDWFADQFLPQCVCDAGEGGAPCEHVGAVLLSNTGGVK